MSIPKHLLTRKAVELALLWCNLRYGPSIWTFSGHMRVSLNSNLPVYGRYVIDEEDVCMIIINPLRHKSLIEMMDTCIHEYIHHKQPIKTDYHAFLDNGYNDETHPFEIEARTIAARDARECRNWVLSRLK